MILAVGQRHRDVDHGEAQRATLHVFLSAGMDGRDVLLGHHAAGDGLIEGKADALFYSVAPFLDDLGRTKTFYPLPIELDKAKIVADQVPGIIPQVWPAGLFGTKTDTPTISHVFGFYGHQDLDDDIVYKILKTMYEHEEELGQVHAMLKEWNKKNALRLITIPVHPGAIKYYKEQGMWTDEMEAKQKKLLAEEPTLKRN